jgi:hypothetical protein
MFKKHDMFGDVWRSPTAAIEQKFVGEESSFGDVGVADSPGHQRVAAKRPTYPP